MDQVTVARKPTCLEELESYLQANPFILAVVYKNLSARCFSPDYTIEGKWRFACLDRSNAFIAFDHPSEWVYHDSGFYNACMDLQYYYRDADWFAKCCLLGEVIDDRTQ